MSAAAGQDLSDCCVFFALCSCLVNAFSRPQKHGGPAPVRERREGTGQAAGGKGQDEWQVGQKWATHGTSGERTRGRPGMEQLVDETG